LILIPIIYISIFKWITQFDQRLQAEYSHMPTKPILIRDLNQEKHLQQQKTRIEDAFTASL